MIWNAYFTLQDYAFHGILSMKRIPTGELAMKTVVELGAEIKARRRELKKSQTALGVESDLRQEVLSRLEHGRLADFSVGKLLRLAHALGLELTLTPLARRRPTLETLLDERKHGANTGPQSR
jgi:predicted XRE-type DNA-binding protein